MSRIRFAVIHVLAGVVAFAPLAGSGVATAQTEEPLDVVQNGIQPTYTSGLSTFKLRTTWDNSMSINWGAIDRFFGNSALTSSRQEDSGQNDLELSTSGWRNRGEVKLGDGLTLGLLGNFDRTRRLTSASQTRNTTDDFGVVAGIKRGTGGWFGSLDGQAGQQEVYREVRRTQGEEGRIERTDQAGPRYRLGGSLKNYEGATKPNVAVSFTANTDRFKQETRERRDVFDLDFTNGVSESDTTLNSTNTSSSFVTNLAWKPVTDLSLDVTGTRRLGESLRPLTFQGGLERTETDDRVLRVIAGYDIGSLNLGLDYGASDLRGTSSATPSANKDVTSEDYRVTVGYVWWGIDLDSSYKSTVKRDDFRPVPGRVPNEDQDSEVRDLRFSAVRDLRTGVTLKYEGQAFLDQKFYEDAFLDNDRRIFSHVTTLTYKPGLPSLTASASFSYKDTRNVNVHPDRASNTESGEELLVVGTLEWGKPSGDYYLNQRIAIAANSAVYDFDDEGQSELTRRNDVTTQVKYRLLEHVRVDFKHIFNFTNQGTYARDVDGIRRFGLTEERSRQDLEVGATYEVTEWLDLKASNSMEVTVNEKPDRDEVRSTFYELLLNGRGSQTFGGIVANFDVTRALSTRQDDYWRVDLGVTRAF